MALEIRNSFFASVLGLIIHLFKGIFNSGVQGRLFKKQKDTYRIKPYHTEGLSSSESQRNSEGPTMLIKVHRNLPHKVQCSNGQQFFSASRRCTRF